MYIDANLLLSDAQALTSTAASTNVIDFGGTGYGMGEPLAVILALDVGTDGTTGDETYSIAMQFDDNSSFSSAATAVTFTIARSTAAGTMLAYPLPGHYSASERYLRLNYTLGGTTPTVTVTAFVAPLSGFQSYTAFPDGFTIS